MPGSTWLLLGALVATAAPALGQVRDSARGDSASQGAPATPPAGGTTRAQDTARGAAGRPLDVTVAAPLTITDTLRFADGRPAAGAMLVAIPLDSGRSPVRYGARADTNGIASLTLPASGSYAVLVEQPAVVTDPERIVVSGASGRTHLLQAAAAPGRSEWELWATIACLLVYLFSILFTRWHHIGRSVHAMIFRQLTALQTRLDTEVGTNGQLPEVQALRKRVEELFDGKDSGHWMPPLWKGTSASIPFYEFFFWSRGRENATWVAIHEIERQLAAFLSPPAQVESYLILAEAELRAISRPGAIVVADAIRAALQVRCPADAAEIREWDQQRKALLGRALSIIYSERDTSFSTLMEWQNKASWLILVALVAMGFLVAAAGNAVLLLAGGLGGYLSRLMRALKREDVPLDYGASWTTLFLSPILGALAGWFGTALISLAASDQLNLLGDAFRLVQWENALAPATIAIAFLLGFSERFFDALVGAVERHADRGELARRAAMVAGPPTAPASTTTPKPGAGAPEGNGAKPGTAAPVITTVSRQSRAAGDPVDTLIVVGSGFVAESRMKINGVVRDDVKVQPPGSAVVPLTSTDLNTIEMGDFELAVENPGGVASAPRKII